MLQAILSTFNKLPYVFKTFVLSIFEWPLKTGFTVLWSRSNFKRDTNEELSPLDIVSPVVNISTCTPFSRPISSSPNQRAQCVLFV